MATTTTTEITTHWAADDKGTYPEYHVAGTPFTNLADAEAERDRLDGVPTAAAKFEAMGNAEFLDYGELFDYDSGPTCPHCDAAFPHSMANNWCWCAGCDACDRARAGVIRYTAETVAWAAENNLRWPPPPAPVALTVEEPF